MPTKTAAKKAANKSADTLTNVTKLVKAAGKDGITVKDVATQAGVTVDTVRKAVKELVASGKVQRDGTKLVPASRQGRRNEDVVARDAAILKAIKSGGKSGKSLKDAAAEVDTTERLAYESLWRLRQQGKVERQGSTRNAVWVAV